MLSYGDTAIVGSVPIRFILTYTTSDFTVDDVVAIGGEVSNFQQEESLIYTATFNSVIAASDTRSIHIPTHVFTDAHGESNSESNLFQWNYDNSRPTITITAEEGVSGFTSSDTTLSLIFTLSEPVIDFVQSDVTMFDSRTWCSSAGVRVFVTIDTASRLRHIDRHDTHLHHKKISRKATLKCTLKYYENSNTNART